jgi:hypothetical protein
MDKKLYSVTTYRIDYNEDVSKMKKDYSVFINAEITGLRRFSDFIVYEEDGIFKELISGIQIPVMEEKIYLRPYDKIPEFPNAQAVIYNYDLNGNYPVFFFLNKIDEANESELNKLREVDQESLNKYVAFIKNRYSGNDGNYQKNWKNFLQDNLLDELVNYGETLDNNGYSDEYVDEYLDKDGKVKKYQK